MKGLELSRAFYEALVAPLLEKLFPGMAYAAGLWGRVRTFRALIRRYPRITIGAPGCSSFWITGRKSGAAG